MAQRKAVLIQIGHQDEARQAAKEGRPKDITFVLSGHGHFDMSAYDAYLSGQLMDYDYPAEAVAKSMAALPKI